MLGGALVVALKRARPFQAVNILRSKNGHSLKSLRAKCKKSTPSIHYAISHIPTHSKGPCPKKNRVILLGQFLDDDVF